MQEGRMLSTASLPSTKKGGLGGIGTKQLQRIAEATGGHVAFKLENCEFSTLVMIKMEESGEGPAFAAK